ncbi:MAG: cytochrome o ubiquinol oxidase subunit IV [bacterium]
MSIPKHHLPAEGNLASYTAGFLLSVILSGAAYLAVEQGLVAGTQLIVMLVAFAILQLMVQLVFFLHLDTVSSRWKLLVFLFMAMVVAILVGGSIWIMNNLNYNMSPAATNSFIIHDEGVTK